MVRSLAVRSGAVYIDNKLGAGRTVMGNRCMGIFLEGFLGGASAPFFLFSFFFPFWGRRLPYHTCTY